MFNKNIKLVLAAAIIAYAVYQITETLCRQWHYAHSLAFSICIFYFKNEIILIGFS